MAAHAQGKFWEMHDKLFAGQAELNPASYEKWAKEIGLNVAKWKADFDGHKHKANIEADSKRGNEIGANGTPAFFINGIPLSGAQPFEAFKAVIDKELKRAEVELKKGTSMDKLYEKLLDGAVAAAPPTAAAAGAPPSEHADIAPGNSPSKGPKNAAIVLLEFSDFQ